MGGTLYFKGGTGSWEAALLPDLPNIGRKWEFGAQGTDLQGVLSLQADGHGNLSGTLIAPDGKALGTAVGTITSQGQIVFDLNGYRFEGQYEFALEQTVAGVYTELRTGKTGEWRMSVPH